MTAKNQKEKRENHFVPQFYLRNFSRDENSVCLYLPGKNVRVEEASIRGQCKRSGFYDFSPGLEDAFGDLEGEAATVIRKILGTIRLPVPNSRDHSTLAAFIVFQRARHSFG